MSSSSSSSSIASGWVKGGLVAAGVMALAGWLFYSKEHSARSASVSHRSSQDESKRKKVRNGGHSSRSSTPTASGSSPSPASSPTNAASSSSDSKTSYAKAAGLAFNDKRYREAINLYGEAIRQDPSNYKLFNNRANAYFALKDYDHVIRDASTSIALAGSDNPNAHFINGKALLNLGRGADALIAFQTARLQLGATPGSETILKNLPQFEKDAKDLVNKKKEEEIAKLEAKLKKEREEKEKELQKEKANEKANNNKNEDEDLHSSTSLTDSTVLVNSTMLSDHADEHSPSTSLTNSTVLVQKPSVDSADEEDQNEHEQTISNNNGLNGSHAINSTVSDPLVVAGVKSSPADSSVTVDTSEMESVVRECVEEAISSAIAAAGQ